MTPSKRVERLRRAVLEAPYEVCVERARYYTRAYRRTEGEHPAKRAAAALAETLDNMTVYVLDDEQIVGNRSSKLVAVVLAVERGELAHVLRTDLKALKSRDFRPFHVSPEDERELLEEILPYWDGKTVMARKRALWKKHGLFWRPNWGLRSWVRRLRQFGWGWVKQFYRLLVKGRLRGLRAADEALATNNPDLVNNVFDTQGHLVLGHKNVVAWGFGGIKRKAQARLEQLRAALSGREPVLPATTGGRRSALDVPAGEGVEDVRRYFRERFLDPDPRVAPTVDHVAFLEAVVTCAEAATRFVRRFAALARELSCQADSPRREELLRIADTCDRVAEDPPRTFREALQLTWFNHVIATISYGMAGVLAVGRADQYLYPFYREDLKAGRITPGEARELLAELLVKLSYNLIMLPSYGKNTGSELGADNAALTVGGVDEWGSDAVNELSYLFADAVEELNSMTNSFSMRYSPSANDRRWLERCVEVFSRTTGGPALFNDDVVIPALVNSGVSLQDARDYAIIGCVEPTSQGNTFGTTSGNDVSLVGALEMVFTDGMVRNAGRRHGARTGDPSRFATFEEVWNAYSVQLEHVVDHLVKCVELKDATYADLYPNPFISATIDGCIDSCRDLTWGGAKYNFASISGRGMATVADSLAAVKGAAFEGGRVSLGGLKRALDRNFRRRGDEALRVYLRERVPKFGNDDDHVDEIARRLVSEFCEFVSSHVNLRGGPYRPSFFSYGMFVVDGFFLGATPDGRRAGEPVSNSFSPSTGAERNGPTAVFKSVAKIDHLQIPNGVSVNVRLLPALVDSPRKRSTLADALLAYFRMGGMHVQFNVVDQSVLIDAQAHPERHLDLVVRVSGYSAYFVDLGKPVQDDIIQRQQFASL